MFSKIHTVLTTKNPKTNTLAKSILVAKMQLIDWHIKYPYYKCYTDCKIYIFYEIAPILRTKRREMIFKYNSFQQLNLI